MSAYYHQETYFKKVLKEQNFEVLKILHKNYLKGESEIQTHSIFTAKKSSN